jgi:predicted component of viral defense system (DUF524 family)
VLLYNQGFRGYSVALRPDFTWIPSHGPWVVLDAKFRLDRLPPRSDAPVDETSQAVAKLADLYKMHTYRDALGGKGVRAAVAVYPGDVTTFYECERREAGNVGLAAVLGDESLRGVGVLALRPLQGEIT